jgi:hypothetical protein
MPDSERSTLFGSASEMTAAIKSVPREKAANTRPLSPTAMLVAAQEFKPAYSPIVLAGRLKRH